MGVALGGIISLEAAITFLGPALQQPQPALANMILDGVNYVSSAWWLSLVLALMLKLIVAGVRGLAGAGLGDEDGY